MGNNSYGGLKGKLTRHYNEYIRECQERERERKEKEIKRNRRRWIRAIDKLKLNDKKFDEWYDSNAIPEEIKWIGDEFEKVLKVLRKRLRQIKQEKL